MGFVIGCFFGLKISYKVGIDGTINFICVIGPIAIHIVD